jgi:ABC-type glycerol-3-phosphate transport system substrate-binding protein
VLEGTLDASDLGLGGGELPAIDVNVDVAAFPGLSEPGRTQLGGGAFYLPNTSSPAGIAGAWDFLSWFNQAGVQARWMEGSTYNPWNTAATGEDTARQWFDTTRPGRWMQVPLDEVDRMDPAFPGPLIGPYAETRNAIRRSLEELLNNGADPADVLAKANTTITEALRRYSDENF